MVDPNKNVVTKKRWSYIKSKRQDNIGGVGPLNFLGETHTDPLTKANIFANYFSSVFTNEDTSHIVGRHSKKLVTIVHFVIKVRNLVYVLKNALYTNLDIGPL